MSCERDRYYESRVYRSVAPFRYLNGSAPNFNSASKFCLLGKQDLYGKALKLTLVTQSSFYFLLV